MIRRILLFAALVAILFASGCSGEFPFRRIHTEPERQAATLVVDDIIALESLIPEPAQPIAKEAKKAARIVQKAVGLPYIPLIPAALPNDDILDAADADASRPQPTPADVVTESAIEVGKIINLTSTVIDEILILAGTVGAAWGIKHLRSKLAKIKLEKDDIATALKTTVAALEEAFGKILSPEEVEKVKTILSDHHDRKDERIIDAIRHGDA